jgi:hypothetical protein
MASGDEIAYLRPLDLTPENGPPHAPELQRLVGGVLGRLLRKQDAAGYQSVLRIPSNGTPLGTGLTLQLATVDDPSNADPGKVYRLGVTVKKLASGTDNLTQTGAGTEATADVTADATSGELILTNVAVTTANADSPAAGDLVLVRIRRIGSHANDTHTGVPLLLGVSVRDT